MKKKIKTPFQISLFNANHVEIIHVLNAKIQHILNKIAIVPSMRFIKRLWRLFRFKNAQNVKLIFKK